MDTENRLTNHTKSVKKVPLQKKHHNKFDLNKWGLSSFLNNLIESSKVSAKIDSDLMKKLHDQFKTILQGRDCLDQYRLWEKVFSFYTVNERFEDLDEIVIRILKDINALSMVPFCDVAPKSVVASSGTLSGVQKGLRTWLFNCLSMAYAVNGGVRDWEKLADKVGGNIDEDFSTNTKILREFVKKQKESVSTQIRNLRSSNLIRHNFCAIPLLNYVDQSEDYNFSKFISKENIASFNLIPKSNKLRYSPRYVHFSEVQYFLRLWSMYDSQSVTKKSVDELFLEFNAHLFGAKNNSMLDCLPVERKDDDGDFTVLHVAEKRKNKDSLKLGIGNVVIKAEYTKDRLAGNQNLSFSRIIDLNHMLNLGVKERVDILVFPELFVPFEWIDYLAKFSKRNQIGIITGVEHFICDSTSEQYQQKLINFACVLLPFKQEQFKNISLDLIEKSNPNEIEKEICDSTGIELVHGKYVKKVYSWRGTSFSILNCLELADIDKRAWMRGNIDLLAVIENNKDTDYFGNIVESISRDLSAYIVQVNNSVYGDSRICQPAKSFEKDILRVKGGCNTTILSAEIRIEELRNYHHLGNSYKNFSRDLPYKPLPPCFKASKFRRPKGKNKS